MLSKKAFVKAIEDIQKIRKLEDEINNAFKPYADCGISVFPFEDAIIQLLEDGMQDVNGNIAFWIYDLEMGTNYSEDKIGYEEIDTKKYADIHSADELYCYLAEIISGDICDKE